MIVLYYLMMIGGGAAMVYGFAMVGSREARSAWGGVALLFGGCALAFFGVLLAFAPRFFT